MNVFGMLTRKRIEQVRVRVPSETLWSRTNRYHQNAAMNAGGSVEGIAKTAVPPVHRARWGRHVSAAPTASQGNPT